LAKLTGSTKAQKLNDNNTADSAPPNQDGSESGAALGSVAAEAGLVPLDEQPVELVADVAPPAHAAERESAVARRPFDTAAFADLGMTFGHDLKASVDAFETAGRNWGLLADQLMQARAEIDRLAPLEVEHDRLANLYAGEKAMTEKLESDVRESRAKEAEASERAKKFEEICETIKERAFEIHNALQQTRTNEQKLQGELSSAQSELTELRRSAQEEAAGRVSAEDQIARLRADVAKFETEDAALRERLAKLIEDNKTMAGQVPQLLADRDNWQKQFSASERENTRMQSQRTIANERIADLENEIKTLRADLASVTSAHAVAIAAPAAAVSTVAATISAPVPATSAEVAAPSVAPAVEDDTDPIDDLDLAASLDRAFSSDESDDGFEPIRKTAG